MKKLLLISIILLLTIFKTINGQEIVLIAGGDVEWSMMIKVPGIYFGIKDDKNKMREDGWRKLPYITTEQSINYIEETFQKDLITERSHHITSIPHKLQFNSVEERNLYPFRKIADILREADVAMINLETPLSDSARNSGSFRTPESFVEGLKWGGIDVVSNANNHAFDCEGAGMIDTKKALSKAGIIGIGTGINLEDARKPFITEKEGIKIAVLSYTYGVNPTITTLGFALPDCSGAMPMDPFLIKEDIKRIRNEVDYIILALHWGIENERDVHPAAREFAYELLNAGADCIIGHHPHVPRGIEVYKGKPIIYSLGNFIFGHSHTYWGDNFLARLTFTKEGIRNLEILPVAGERTDLAQPYLLEGERAEILLKDIQKRSVELNTKLEIKENIGIVHLISDSILD